MSVKDPLPRIEPDEYEQLEVNIANTVRSLMFHWESEAAFYRAWDKVGRLNPAFRDHPASKLAHVALDMMEDAILVTAELALLAGLRMREGAACACQGSQAAGSTDPSDAA